MKRFGWLFLSLVLVAAMLLASCGTAEEPTTTGTGSTVTGTTTTPTPSAPTGSGTVTPPPPPAGAETVKDALGRTIEKPQYGGNYIYAVGTDINGFDNAYTYPYLTNTLNITNEPLMAGDWAKGPAGSGEVSWQILGVTFMQASRMRVAESWEAPDGETLIFHIRKGINFQNKPPVNGRELDADDVVYTLKRCFETPGSYLNFTYKGDDAPVSIKALDKWTVEIKSKPGKQGPLFIVTAGYIAIFPRDGVPAGGNYKDWKSSIGSGALEMVDYVPNSSITFQKNPNYWMADPLIPQNKLPYVDKATRLVIADESTRISALKTGKIDNYAGITWDNAETLHKTNPGLKMGKFTLSYSYSIHMALGKGKAWDDKRVRHALWMATDLNKIRDTFYGGNAESFTFPIMPFPELGGMFTPLVQLPQNVQDLYKYNPTKAKQLLTEAGFPTGFKAEIVTSSASQSGQDLLVLISDMWKEVGVELTVKPLENAVWTAQVQGKTFADMAYWYDGNSAPYKMNNWRPLNPQNAGNVVAPDLVEVYNELNKLYPFDEAGAMALIKAQTPKILEEAWVITVPQAYVFYFYQPWLKNYNGESSVGYYQAEGALMYRWIDSKLKAEMQK